MKQKPFVISISGMPGSGKTTISKALNECLKNSVIVSFDSYDDIYLGRDINDWSADTHDANEWHMEPMVGDIEELFAKPLDYIIIDYPFGYCNFQVGQYIDFAVFVDIPLDMALARRIIRDYTSREEHRNKIEVSLLSVEKELRHYLKVSRPTYMRLPETQLKNADLVVNGTKNVDEICDEIITTYKLLIK